VASVELITFEVFQVDEGEYRIANERPPVTSGVSNDMLQLIPIKVRKRAL
jgi:hypothetical protein